MGDSTVTTASKTTSTKAAGSQESIVLGAKASPWITGLARFLQDDPCIQTAPLDAKADKLRFKKMAAKVQRRMYVVLGLVFLNVILAPLLRPTYQYIALSDKKETKPLFSLLEPNQTDQAVLSWAATSITEIMTFGFGDFDQRILAQRVRFTPIGWKSFLEALIQQQISEKFKTQQLVLTTIPTDSPVIISKGVVEDDEYVGEEQAYQWIVEMPVIMTYTTNNSVSSASRGIVRLTIVRVSGKQNPTGIGIKTWQFV